MTPETFSEEIALPDGLTFTFYHKWAECRGRCFACFCDGPVSVKQPAVVPKETA